MLRVSLPLSSDSTPVGLTVIHPEVAVGGNINTAIEDDHTELVRFCFRTTRPEFSLSRHQRHYLVLLLLLLGEQAPRRRGSTQPTGTPRVD